MESDDYDAFDEEEETVVQKLNKLWKDVPQQEATKPLVFGENVNKMMVKLYSMRQNSKSHEEFGNLESLTESLITKAAQQGQFVVEARFLLEQAKNAHFRKDMRRTIALSNEVIVKSQHLRPYETYQLQLICRFLMTSCYNHLRDFGTAWDILQQLQQTVEPTENYVDKWKLYYNLGTHYLAYLKTLGEPLPAVRTHAKESFAKCRDAITIAISSGASFGIQEKIYPLVMMAKILLDTPETKPGQQRNMVTVEDMEEVGETISNIKESIPAHLMGVRLKARLAITEGGLHFRRAQRNTTFAMKAKQTKQDERYKRHLHNAYRKVSQALICLDYARSMCMSTPYEELQYAEDFTEYIERYAQQNIHAEHPEEIVQTDTSSASSGEASNIFSESDRDQSSSSVASNMSDTSDSELGNLSEKLNTLFLAGVTRKHFLYDSIPWDVQESGMQDLDQIQQLVTSIIGHHYKAMSSEHSINEELALYPRLLKARIGTDFPETPWGMNRFAVTVENLAEVKEQMDFIKESIHPHRATSMFKVYYLLCEGGLHQREGQMNHNMKNVKKTKLHFTDAIFRIEHALYALVNDVSNIKGDFDNLLKLLTKVQKKLYKM